MTARFYPAIQEKFGKIHVLTNGTYDSIEEAKRAAHDLGLCRRRQRASTWLFGDDLVIARVIPEIVMCKYVWTKEWEWVEA